MEKEYKTTSKSEEKELHIGKPPKGKKEKKRKKKERKDEEEEKTDAQERKDRKGKYKRGEKFLRKEDEELKRRS